MPAKGSLPTPSDAGLPPQGHQDHRPPSCRPCTAPKGLACDPLHLRLDSSPHCAPHPPVPPPTAAFKTLAAGAPSSPTPSAPGSVPSLNLPTPPRLDTPTLASHTQPQSLFLTQPLSGSSARGRSPRSQTPTGRDSKPCLLLHRGPPDLRTILFQSLLGGWGGGL